MNAKSPVKDLYNLYDGTTVTKEEILDVANRYHSSYKSLGVLMVSGFLLVTIAMIADFRNPLLGYLLTLGIIDSVFIILAIIFFVMYKKVDLIKLGLSIMNFRRKLLMLQEKNADDYNEIEGDEIMNLSIKRRNFIFVNHQTQKWQFRQGRAVSKIMDLTYIKSIVIKPLRTDRFQCILTMTDGVILKLFADSPEGVQKLQKLV